MSQRLYNRIDILTEVLEARGGFEEPPDPGFLRWAARQNMYKPRSRADYKEMERLRAQKAELQKEIISLIAMTIIHLKDASRSAKIGDFSGMNIDFHHAQNRMGEIDRAVENLYHLG